jgi:putative inorganic carbon (hco3(-)) transporter
MYVALLVAGVFVTFVYRQKKWLVVQLCVVGAGFVLEWLLFHVVAHTVLQHSLNAVAGSASSRLVLWGQTVELIKAHPLLGVGPMHFAYYPYFSFGSPHNILLQLAVECGIPAAIFILGLFFLGLVGWLKVSDLKTTKENVLSANVVPISLTASLIAGTCYSLVSGVLVTPLGQIMACVVIGWALGYYYAQTKTVSLCDSVAAQIFFVILVLLGFIGVIAGIFPAIFSLSANEIKWLYDRNFHTLYRPRFWLQGYLR